MLNECLLTVREVAELKNCTERNIQLLVQSRKLEGVALSINEQSPGRGGLQYRIPLSALDKKLQIKYKRLKRIEKAKDMEIALPEQIEQINYEDITTDERIEIELWKSILNEWQQFRDGAKSKAEADKNFIELMDIQNPDLKITRRTLYRKWKALNEDGEFSLIDKRGKHGNHTTKLDNEVWEMFEYYYLDENRRSVEFCIKLTELNIQKENLNELLPLPSYDTFNRKANNIKPAYIEYYRYGRTAFLDNCAPYIKRQYKDVESNDIWVADNHTFDIMVKRDNKPMRIHLTAFLDVRSRKMMGWYLTDNPCGDATIYALRRGIEKYGIPKMIYTDNGREFLFKDFGGNGFRRKKKDEEFKPPTILEKLDIEFRTALPKNGKAKIIERTFRTVKENLSRLFLTYTGGHILERPERLKEVIKDTNNIPEIDKFAEYVDTYFYGWYNKQPHSGEGMNNKCPDDVFAENLFEQRIALEEDLNLMLMRYSNLMTVRRNGVNLNFYGKELQYWTDDLLLNYLGKKVYIRYNPENLESVRVYSKEDVFISEVPLKTELSYKASKESISEEMKDRRSLERTVRAYKKNKDIRVNDELELILEEASRNMEEKENIDPKVIRMIRNEEYQSDDKVVGAEEDNIIDWTEALENFKRIKENM